MGRNSAERSRSLELTLGNCWRAFIRLRTPPVLGGAVLVALVLRASLGSFDWRDLVVAVSIVALTPLAEWAIHVYLLHAKPVRVGTHRYDLLAAREHRAHHQDPAELDGVLIPRCHFLIHTPYRPRGRYYRSIWRGHRLHHYKNEHYWFGVTSTVGDHLLKTAPDQSAVPKSNTARTLGVEIQP